MKRVVYSDVVAYEEGVDKEIKTRERRASISGSAVERQRWQLAAEITIAQQSNDLVRQAAACRMQAAHRGRAVRIRNRAMTREEGDRLWYGTIKPVIQELFDSISGQDGTMDGREFRQHY